MLKRIVALLCSGVIALSGVAPAAADCSEAEIPSADSCVEEAGTETEYENECAEATTDSEDIYELHEDPINSAEESEGFCVEEAETETEDEDDAGDGLEDDDNEDIYELHKETITEGSTLWYSMGEDENNEEILIAGGLATRFYDDGADEEEEEEIKIGVLDAAEEGSDAEEGTSEGDIYEIYLKEDPASAGFYDEDGLYHVNLWDCLGLTVNGEEIDSYNSAYPVDGLAFVLTGQFGRMDGSFSVYSDGMYEITVYLSPYEIVDEEIQADASSAVASFTFTFTVGVAEEENTDKGLFFASDPGEAGFYDEDGLYHVNLWDCLGFTADGEETTLETLEEAGCSVVITASDCSYDEDGLFVFSVGVHVITAQIISSDNDTRETLVLDSAEYVLTVNEKEGDDDDESKEERTDDEDKDNDEVEDEDDEHDSENETEEYDDEDDVNEGEDDEFGSNDEDEDEGDEEDDNEDDVITVYEGDKYEYDWQIEDDEDWDDEEENGNWDGGEYYEDEDGLYLSTGTVEMEEEADTVESSTPLKTGVEDYLPYILMLAAASMALLIYAALKREENAQ